MRKEEPMKTKNLRRGATLTEIMVVIAVVAIVAVLVVSFSTMVSSSRELAQAKLDALQDIRLAETIIENFIVDGANSGEITLDTKKTVLTNKNKDQIRFEGWSLIVDYAVTNKADIQLELDSVKEIKFDTHENGNDTIYYCTISYEVGGTPFEYTFCVNPYAGEEIGG